MLTASATVELTDATNIAQCPPPFVPPTWTYFAGVTSFDFRRLTT